jgi:hypothetical protein
MAAIKYTKGELEAEADIQRLEGGRYQGVVQIINHSGGDGDAERHLVEALSESPEEALDEAKALAHRLLGAHGGQPNAAA